MHRIFVDYCLIILVCCNNLHCICTNDPSYGQAALFLAWFGPFRGRWAAQGQPQRMPLREQSREVSNINRSKGTICISKRQQSQIIQIKPTLSELRNGRSFYYLLCAHKQIPPVSSSLHFICSPSLPHTHPDTQTFDPCEIQKSVGLHPPCFTLPWTSAFSFAPYTIPSQSQSPCFLLHRYTERMSYLPKLISEQQITPPTADCSTSMTPNLPAAFLTHQNFFPGVYMYSSM